MKILRGFWKYFVKIVFWIEFKVGNFLLDDIFRNKVFFTRKMRKTKISDLLRPAIHLSHEKCIAGYFTSLFCVSRPFFRFSHFVPGSAFAPKGKEFCGLFFCGINTIRNLHEIQKVYSKCFVFCGVSRKHSQDTKYEKCIAGLKLATHLSFLAFRHVHVLFCELFCETVNQSVYTSHNIAGFVHLWFCEKLDECTNSGVKSCEIGSHVRRGCGVF